jgi:HSP20 family protein
MNMDLLPSREVGTGLSAMQRQMNRLFEDFLGHPFGALAGREGWGPAVDVAETEEAVLVTAEIPGVDPAEVEITVSGDELTLRGEKKEEIEESGRAWHRVERRHGRFVRSIGLPAPVDADRVEAAARDGVLTVTLPKRADARPRRIEVRAG